MLCKENPIITHRGLTICFLDCRFHFVHRLSDRLKSEVLFMEKLGDSIMNELETAEDEVCNAWGEIFFISDVT